MSHLVNNNARDVVGRVPAVSFVTAAYNAATTIDETVASVVAQTDPRWELIIVDDGSRDDTLARARVWASRDSRICVLARENGGPASARNLGVAQARGDWLMFLDADDWLKPNFIADLLPAADGADVLVSAHDRVDSSGAVVGVASAPRLPDPFAMLARSCPIVPIAAMVRIEIARRIGGFDPGMVSSEDWQFWLRAARAGARFRTVEENLSAYRMQPGSLSRRAERYVVDGLRVVGEGFIGEDAAGDAAEAADARAGYLMYAATMAACGGGDPAAVLAEAADLRAWSFDPMAWGGAVAFFAAYASARRPEDLARDWDALAQNLERLFAALEARMGDASHVDRLRLHVRAHAFGLRALADAPEVGSARLGVLDIAADTLDLEPDATHGVVLVTARDRLLGVLEAPRCALADARERKWSLRSFAPSAPLRPALRGLADLKLALAVVRAVAELQTWANAPGMKAKLWTIASRAVADRLSGAPLAVGARAFAQIAIRDRRLRAEDVAARLAALARQRREMVASAEIEKRCASGADPGANVFSLVVDGAALGPSHPVLDVAPPATTIFCPPGGEGAPLRAEAKRRGVRLGVRCPDGIGLARKSPADLAAWFAAARADLDDPAPGVLFASGDVDNATRWAARRAGFTFGVNPEPDFAYPSQDSMLWRRLDIRATDPVEAFAARVAARA